MIKRLPIAFVLAALTAITSAQAPIAIGLVRADAHLVPIALLTPDNVLGADQLRRALPAETWVHGQLIDRNEPQWPFEQLSWQLFAGPTKPVAFRTLKPATVESHCEELDAWSTTLKAAPRKANQAVALLGLAASSAVIEFPQDVTTPPDPQSKRVAERIVSLFLTKETARLASQDSQRAVTLPESPGPVRIEVLMRHRANGATTYYFEATRPLKLSDGAVADDAGLVTGWIVDGQQVLKDFDVTYKINDGSYKENDRAIVRGIVPYRGRMLWVLEWHGWEWEYYTVHDWPSGKLALTVHGGGC